MLLDPQRISESDKAIIVGLYLSRFDDLGLKRLGFDNFTEAFNVLGYAVGSPVAQSRTIGTNLTHCFPIPAKVGADVPGARIASRYLRRTNTLILTYLRI